MGSNPRSTHCGTVLLVIAGLGCHSWHVQTASPSAVLEQYRPARVQVRPIDGDQFVLASPALAGDTLLGLRSGTPSRIPLATVDAVAVRRFSPGRTALLVLTVPAGLTVLLLLGCATSNCGY